MEKRRRRILSKIRENEPTQGSMKSHAGCRRTHWHARKHSPVTRLLASSSHIQPEAASSHVAPPTVQLLLSELAAARDRVGSLEKELTNIFMGGESVVHSVDQHLEMDDSDHRAELEGSSLQYGEYKEYLTGPGFPNPYDEYTQTWDRGMAILQAYRATE